MLKTALLLLLLAVWYYAPDMALALDGNTRAVTYRANGIFGATLAILARDHSKDTAWRIVCDAAAFCFVMQPVCDCFWVTEGVNTASVCNDVFAWPMSDVFGAGLAAFAGWFYDNKTKGGGNG